MNSNNFFRFQRYRSPDRTILTITIDCPTGVLRIDELTLDRIYFFFKTPPSHLPDYLDGLIEAATLPLSRGAILREFVDSKPLEELRERFFRVSPLR
jgi:hypothetical protein